MIITDELLQTIADRVKQVFYARKNYTPDNIEMYEDGSFLASKTFRLSYGGQEIESENITANDLNADLDELVLLRKAKEAKEEAEYNQRQKENKERYERQQKEKRHAEYNKLKKEFENGK